MKFSLILSTVNRTTEVEEFLESLSRQTYGNFEVILVDQNHDNRILNIVKKFKYLNIRYLKSEKGLSKARNIGLLSAKGDIVGFPDDDCTYPAELLRNINSFFEKNNYTILMGKTIDKKTKEIVAGSLSTKASNLSCNNIHGSSTTLFICLNKLNDFTFDERFGLGATYHAEEENDLVLRLLKKGFKGFYNPEINFVYHPPSDLDYKNYYRIQERAIGLGAFIAKHIGSVCGVSYFFKYNIVRPLSASIFYMLKFDYVKAKFYFYKFLGIWKGFIMYISERKK